MENLSQKLKNSKKLRQQFLLNFTREGNPFDAYEIMEEGDYVITISSCVNLSNNLLRPKKLNDKVSPEFTDRIAEIRNSVLIEEFKEMYPALQTFKEVVLISKNFDLDDGKFDKVRDVLRAQFIELCQQELGTGLLNDTQKDFLNKLIGELKNNKEILKFVYGVSKVSTLTKDRVENYKIKRWHLTESLINARIMSLIPKAYGYEGNLFDLVFQRVRDFISKYGCSSIYDTKGNKYDLFVQENRSEDDRYALPQFVLNLELIFLIRKGEFDFKDDKENRKVFNALDRYINLLSIFGVIFYYTNEDIEEEQFLNRIQLRSEVLNSLRGNANNLTQKKLRLVLFRDFYYPQLASKLKFDLRAKKAQGGTILVLDAQGLGSKDLVDCDSLARFMSRSCGRSVSDVKDFFMRIFSVRGDKITKELREDIVEIMRILKTNEDSSLMAYRRGDSLFIYTSQSDIDPIKLSQITKPLHNEFRLVTVPVPEKGFKDSIEYMETMEKIFKGEDFCKHVEKMRRSLESSFDFYIDFRDDYFNLISIDEQGDIYILDKRKVD